MKRIVSFLIGFTLVLSFVNCTEDFDDNPQRTSVNDFIWKGLNQYYYWLQDSPDLADNRFGNTEEYQNFITSFNTS